MIIDGWKPEISEYGQYGLFLEDDIEVSPAFYEWAEYCVNFTSKYEKRHGNDSGLIGCSLYTPKVDEITSPQFWRPVSWNVSDILGIGQPIFFFQLPCSWGALYKGKYWADFLQYYRETISDNIEIMGSNSNYWFKSWKRCSANLLLDF